MRSRSVLTGVLVTAMMTASTGAAQQAQQKERCGTRQPSLEDVDAMEQRLARGRSRARAAATPTPTAAPTTTDTIQVWVHVIRKGSGFANGDVPDAMIRDQIRSWTIHSPVVPAAPRAVSRSSSPA